MLKIIPNNKNEVTLGKLQSVVPNGRKYDDLYYGIHYVGDYGRELRGLVTSGEYQDHSKQVKFSVRPLSKFSIGNEFTYSISLCHDLFEYLTFLLNTERTSVFYFHSLLDVAKWLETAKPGTEAAMSNRIYLSDPVKNKITIEELELLPFKKVIGVVKNKTEFNNTRVGHFITHCGECGVSEYSPDSIFNGITLFLSSYQNLSFNLNLLFENNREDVKMFAFDNLLEYATWAHKVDSGELKFENL